MATGLALGTQSIVNRVRPGRNRESQVLRRMLFSVPDGLEDRVRELLIGRLEGEAAPEPGGGLNRLRRYPEDWRWQRSATRLST